MQFTRRLKTAFTCSSGLAPLRLWGHPRSAWQGRTRGVGEGRLRRGMAGVQEWPPGLDHRRPFFDENPRQGVYLQLPIPVPQMRSGLPIITLQTGLARYSDEGTASPYAPPAAVLSQSAVVVDP